MQESGKVDCVERKGRFFAIEINLLTKVNTVLPKK